MTDTKRELPRELFVRANDRKWVTEYDDPTTPTIKYIRADLAARVSQVPEATDKDLDKLAEAYVQKQLDERGSFVKIYPLDAFVAGFRACERLNRKEP